MNNQRKLYLAVVVLMLAVLSCADLRVTNKTTVPVRIRVRMPGGSSSDTEMLSANTDTYFVSEFGGSYSVSAVPDESYRQSLMDARTGLQKIFSPESKDTSPEQVVNAVLGIDRIDRALEEIKWVTCSGTLSREGTAVAEISWDDYTGKWTITCTDY